MVLQLGREDGFNADPAIHIPLPQQLATAMELWIVDKVKAVIHLTITISVIIATLLVLQYVMELMTT